MTSDRMEMWFEVQLKIHLRGESLRSWKSKSSPHLYCFFILAVSTTSHRLEGDSDGAVWIQDVEKEAGET